MMIEKDAGRRWFAAILTRALVLGTALGVIASAGTAMILPAAGAQPLPRAMVVSMVLVAFGVGLWAGAPRAQEEEVRPGERWISAAALAAVGGSFATFRGLYEAVYPGPWWGPATLIFVLGLPIYAVGLVVPPLLAWGERGLDEDGVGEGWGALGPLVLGTVFGIGIGLVASGIASTPGATSAALLMGAAVLLLSPFVLPSHAHPPVRETVLYETTSPFAELRVTEVVYPGERQPERRLYLDGEEESGELVRSGAPTLAYIASSERWLSDITPAGSRYLFLGGGAYTLPRRISERDPRARITVVEIDPTVTRIAERFFGLKSAGNIVTVHADARAYLDQAEPRSYDRIFIDVYAGSEKLPISLLTEQAASAILAALKDDGVFAANVISTAIGPERKQLWSVVRTFAHVFRSIALYSHLGPDFPDRQNFLLVGSPNRTTEWPARAGFFDLWENQEWPSVEGSVIYRDIVVPDKAQEVSPSTPRPGRLRA